MRCGVPGQRDMPRSFPRTARGGGRQRGVETDARADHAHVPPAAPGSDQTLVSDRWVGNASARVWSGRRLGEALMETYLRRIGRRADLVIARLKAAKGSAMPKLSLIRSAAS